MGVVSRSYHTILYEQKHAPATNNAWHVSADTTQMCAEDKENDLTPPLEHCIRTK